MMNYTPEQLEEHRKLWTAALRSGEFKQGIGALCKDGKYCCLGVGCEIAIENGAAIEKKDQDYAVFYNGAENIAPLAFQEWVGLQDKDGDYGFKSLISLNDDRKLSFSEIADIIDSKPVGLFV